jgi:predicted outer membrane protein
MRSDTIVAGADTAIQPADTNPRLGTVGILSALTVANKKEIVEAKYAVEHASHAAVKGLARQLIADHTKNMEQSQKLADRLGVSGQIPNENMADSTLPPELQDARGPDFDQAFVMHQREAHQMNVNKIRTQFLPSADNAELRQYLQETVTAMEGHLKQIDQIQTQTPHNP